MVATIANEILLTSRGLTLECEPGDEVITKAIRDSGQWEEGVALAIEEHLAPGWTFLDLGAHIGYFSLLAAKRGNPVIAVEANPRYQEMLKRNAIANGVGVLLMPFAVSDFEGGGFLKRDARFAANPAASYLGVYGGHTAVKVRRLVDLLGEERPEFIKADIEGLEYRVLKDSPEILDGAKALIIEVGREMCARFDNSIADVVDLLQSHGFEVTFCDGSSLDARLDMKQDYYTNLLAIRKDGSEDAPAPASAEAPKVIAPATVILCAWRNLLAETAECLLLLRDQGWGYVIKRGDALISRSRSIAVSNWYRQTDEDVFLMIDDDVVFESTGAAKVVQLARDTRSVACAAYPVKDGGHLACRRLPGQTIVFGEGSPPVEIKYPATGFMAVHRDVIEAMVAAKNGDGSSVFPLCDAHGLVPMWPFFDTFVLTGEDGHSEYLSEDYAFGEQALRLGFKTWLDPSVILYHMGQYPYTIENMKNVKNLEVARE